jgi:hypothetical protein
VLAFATIVINVPIPSVAEEIQLRDGTRFRGLATSKAGHTSTYEFVGKKG